MEKSGPGNPESELDGRLTLIDHAVGTFQIGMVGVGHDDLRQIGWIPIVVGADCAIVGNWLGVSAQVCTTLAEVVGHFNRIQSGCSPTIWTTSTSTWAKAPGSLCGAATSGRVPELP